MMPPGPRSGSSAWVGRHWLEACSRCPVQRPPEGLTGPKDPSFSMFFLRKKKTHGLMVSVWRFNVVSRGYFTNSPEFSYDLSHSPSFLPNFPIFFPMIFEWRLSRHGHGHLSRASLQLSGGSPPCPGESWDIPL